ncbi:MAG: HEPN domain-containing protein [Cellulosilyticaceae bacterium]
MKHNSYLGRGMSDYLYAKKSMEDKAKTEYNWPVVIFSQAAEKILKAVIETKFADDSSCIALMRTHNLRTIVAKIVERYPEAKLSSKDCKWLGDFYFDARYPGDDFIVVTLQDAVEAEEIVACILQEVEKILDTDDAKELFEYYKVQL